MTATTKRHRAAVSAPGKVLLAGGYLVLDRAYTGLVFGLSARIHVVVQDAVTPDGEAPLIVVRSPQFTDAEWRYAPRLLDEERGVEVTQLESPADSRNPFVETALAYTLTYITATLPLPTLPSLHITILADNAYYSQPTSTTTTTTTTTPTPTPTPTPYFATFPTPLSGAHKTGLGSSAALTTALTAALLSALLPTPPAASLHHNLAQSIHCAAQGKIGSGFDVAAAVFGSCLYRRFSPALLAPISDAASGPGTPRFAARLRAVADDNAAQWDAQVAKPAAALPDGYALVMCDVDCGSQSVGMAKQVLAWRASAAADARRIWDALQGANEGLARALAARPVEEGEVRAAFAAVRGLVREMGGAAGVAIEPVEQTALLDKLGGVEGVVGGVVPGAGGYDAVALVVRDEEGTMGRVRGVLEGWGGGGGKVRLLGVKGEMEGLRVEGEFDYGAWIS